MRASYTGSICDKCKKPLSPFEVIKIKGVKTIRGKNYKNVSSDTTSKSIHLLDLCEDCYNSIFNIKF